MSSPVPPQASLKIDNIINLISTLLLRKHRIIIGISGICGSGKSFQSELIYKKLQEGCVDSIIIPMDGFHLYSSKLDEKQLERRGAHYTFDSEGFYQKMMELVSTCGSLGGGTADTADGTASTASTVTAGTSTDNTNGTDNTTITTQNTSQTIKFNGWDHALKDPSVNAIEIGPKVRVILLEGMHIFLDLEPWCLLRTNYDLKIWVDADLEVCMTRLVKRHVVSGLSRDESEGRARVDGNDRKNAMFLLENCHLEFDYVLQNH
jgi:pantothenate kinase